MSDQNIRELLIQSQPEIYHAGGDASIRLMLQQAARENPRAVIEVLLEDLIWRLFLEELVAHDKTPSVDQILELARHGDYELAHERTHLAFHLEVDKATLLQRFAAAANHHLMED